MAIKLETNFIPKIIHAAFYSGNRGKGQKVAKNKIIKSLNFQKEI